MKYQAIKFPAVGGVVLLWTFMQYSATPKVIRINTDVSHTEKVNEVELSISFFLQSLDYLKLTVTAFFFYTIHTLSSNVNYHCPWSCIKSKHAIVETNEQTKQCKRHFSR